MGILYVVATPIGNLSDISERALSVLREVDIILCEDTRHSLKLLNHYDIKNNLVSYHKFNEKERSNSIIEKLESGKNIALISDAGTPCISDPGYILVRDAKNRGIEVVGVGGISALITGISVSGLNSDSFSFYGFFPRENKDKLEIIENIKKSDIKTFIFYESPKRIIKSLEYIFDNLGNVLISVSSDLTKLHEKNYYGRLDNVINDLKSNDNSNLGEYTFIIENDLEITSNDKSLSIEAMIIDEMINNNISMKEAIDVLNNKNKDLHKKDIYNASLNLKNILK